MAEAASRRIRFTSTCPAATFRPGEVCKHATRAARRLVREGLAVRDGSVFRDTLPRPAVAADDPWADVERYSPAGAA